VHPPALLRSTLQGSPYHLPCPTWKHATLQRVVTSPNCTLDAGGRKESARNCRDRVNFGLRGSLPRQGRANRARRLPPTHRVNFPAWAQSCRHDVYPVLVFVIRKGPHLDAADKLYDHRRRMIRRGPHKAVKTSAAYDPDRKRYSWTPSKQRTRLTNIRYRAMDGACSARY
jgi:hypothetical protein